MLFGSEYYIDFFPFISLLFFPSFLLSFHFMITLLPLSFPSFCTCFFHSFLSLVFPSLTLPPFSLCFSPFSLSLSPFPLHSFLSVPPSSLPLPFLPLSFFWIPYSPSLLPPPLIPLSPFLPAHIPLFLYPFLHTVSKSRPFEYLRLTSLGVVGALVKVTGLNVLREQI